MTEHREDKKYIALILIIAIVIAAILLVAFFEKEKRIEIFNIAVCNNDVTKVEVLLRRDPELINAQGMRNKIKPLFGASSKEMAELLIQYGADINARTPEGYMPIHAFVSNSSKGALELLIAKGADVNAKSNYGNTPLHCASDIGNIEAAKILLSHGAEINAKNNNGDTPLKNAIEGKFNYKEQKAFADFLRKHGAKE
jgi:cytohesin